MRHFSSMPLAAVGRFGIDPSVGRLAPDDIRPARPRWTDEMCENTALKITQLGIDVGAGCVNLWRQRSHNHLWRKL